MLCLSKACQIAAEIVVFLIVRIAAHACPEFVQVLGPRREFGRPCFVVDL
jgi:hypothetical protein